MIWIWIANQITEDFRHHWLYANEQANYRRHHVELERHGDHVESDDARDAQIEVLAADDDVKNETRLGVVGPVRQLA